MDPLCFRPLENRIVVRRSEERERISGLYVPAGAADIPTEGTVMAVGPGLVVDGKLIKPTLRAGDDVLFGKYSGSSFEHERQTYLVMRESEVLGVIDRDAGMKTDKLSDALVGEHVAHAGHERHG